MTAKVESRTSTFTKSDYISLDHKMHKVKNLKSKFDWRCLPPVKNNQFLNDYLRFLVFFVGVLRDNGTFAHV